MLGKPFTSDALAALVAALVTVRPNNRSGSLTVNPVPWPSFGWQLLSTCLRKH